MELKHCIPHFISERYDLLADDATIVDYFGTAIPAFRTISDHPKEEWDKFRDDVKENWNEDPNKPLTILNPALDIAGDQIKDAEDVAAPFIKDVSDHTFETANDLIEHIFGKLVDSPYLMVAVGVAGVYFGSEVYKNLRE